MFGFFKKKESYEPLNKENNVLTAIGNGKLIPIESVSDQMFAEKMLGDSVAFAFEGKDVDIYCPVNGKLSVLFPTGHAFGVTTEDGVEVLVHIGVDTVNAKGDGFKLLGKKQDDHVCAGDPIVSVDFNKLKNTYDMSTMLIITNANGKTVNLIREGDVTRESVVGTIE